MTAPRPSDADFQRFQLFCLAAARSALAALQPSDSCFSCASRQLRMAPLARSMLAQSFCTSAEQAARTLARASCVAFSGGALWASAVMGSTASASAAPKALRCIGILQVFLVAIGVTHIELERSDAPDAQ